MPANLSEHAKYINQVMRSAKYASQVIRLE